MISSSGRHIVAESGFTSFVYAVWPPSWLKLQFLTQTTHGCQKHHFLPIWCGYSIQHFVQTLIFSLVPAFFALYEPQVYCHCLQRKKDRGGGGGEGGDGYLEYSVSISIYIFVCEFKSAIQHKKKNKKILCFVLIGSNKKKKILFPQNQSECQNKQTKNKKKGFLSIIHKSNPREESKFLCLFHSIKLEKKKKSFLLLLENSFQICFSSSFYLFQNNQNFSKKKNPHFHKTFCSEKT